MSHQALVDNDFAHGFGEVEMSAVDAKVSLPAINNAVKVSCFAYDPRKVFADMANARTFTRLASMYQAGKIQSVGHTPVPDPGPEPREDRIFVKALLPTPLTKLSLSRSGNLIIPYSRTLGGVRRGVVECPDNPGKTGINPEKPG